MCVRARAREATGYSVRILALGLGYFPVSYGLGGRWRPQNNTGLSTMTGCPPELQGKILLLTTHVLGKGQREMELALEASSVLASRHDARRCSAVLSARLSLAVILSRGPCMLCC